MLDRSGESREWWRGAVIYQIYPRSFADTNHDGIGDLPGVTAHLDHVARLGVDAIWLSPVFASPQRDFGYDVSDHTAIDPIFGTMDDFDALVARAHALGLRVLIDQVWSHSSDQHPWFSQSRASRCNPTSDWYVWADPSADGTPPNNWLSVFGGAAWSWEPRRRQYYLHHFLSHQPQLNLHNMAVQDALLEAGKFWLDRGVDGFRLDALDFFTHDPALRSNPAAPPGAVGVKLFGRQVHAHDMMQPQTQDFLARIRALTDAYPGAVTLGEVSSQDGALARCRRYSRGAEALHMAYSLQPMRGRFDASAMRALLAEAGRADEGWLCWGFSNHDVERAISRWNPDPEPGATPDPRFARLLLAFHLSLRGSVLIYQGEELGLTEAQLTADQLRDPFGMAYWPEFKGRDGSRTPMPWVRRAPHAGFTTATPWLPVPGVHAALAVDAQEEDPTALLHVWRRLLSFRRAHPVLATGSLEVLDLAEPLVGVVRRCAYEQVICLFNLSGQAQSFGDIEAVPGGVLEPYGTAFVVQPVMADRPIPEMA
jgi:alpha-glucosidase